MFNCEPILTIALIEILLHLRQSLMKMPRAHKKNEAAMTLDIFACRILGLGHGFRASYI